MSAAAPLPTSNGVPGSGAWESVSADIMGRWSCGQAEPTPSSRNWVRSGWARSIGCATAGEWRVDRRAAVRGPRRDEGPGLVLRRHRRGDSQRSGAPRRPSRGGAGIGVLVPREDRRPACHRRKAVRDDGARGRRRRPDTWSKRARWWRRRSQRANPISRSGSSRRGSRSGRTR